MDLFNEVFQWLPLAAVIENSVFVVHGGLSTNSGGADSGDASLGKFMAIPLYLYISIVLVSCFI